jgi:hypothetical protein
MNGFIKTLGRCGGAAGLIALAGCCGYWEAVDPCYPARYTYMADREVFAALAPQVNNGQVLDQTVWNYHFVCGTDCLTAGGLEHLAYLARRRPHPDTCVFLQTAQDICYDPHAPDKMAECRADLDCRRVQAIQKFLTAQTGGQCAWKVEVHDPAEVGINAIAANASSQQMLNTRFRGGLPGGGGGGVAGGGAAGPGQ